MNYFKNPELLPIEHLKLEIKRNGIVEHVPALSEKWLEDRYFLHYEAPNMYNDNGSEIFGAKEYWMEITSYIIDDLKWLLSLPFHRFWSNIIHERSIMDSLISCLQGIHPYYALQNFPNDSEMMDLLEMLRRYVLVIYARLITNKDSPSEYITPAYFGNLLYHQYVFTVPVIFDLSQLYGRENAKTVEKILKSLFTIQLFYYEDVRKSVPYIVEALKKIQRLFDNQSRYPNGNISLVNYTNYSVKITPAKIEDMIFYLFDIISNITVLIQNYPPILEVFHEESFINNIVSIYETTIPKMYQHLNELVGKNNGSKYEDLKHRLDVIRVEILSLYQNLMYKYLLNFLDKRTTLEEIEIKEHINSYLLLLTNAVSEKEFITDYNQFYPIQADLEVLSMIFPEIDPIKCNYLIQSVSTTIGDVAIPTNPSSNNQISAGPSGIQHNNCATNSVKGPIKTMEKDSVEMKSLITAVKDVLDQLVDEKDIEVYLRYYNYNTESVINAVLEGNLPPNLQKIDFSSTNAPPEKPGPSIVNDLPRALEKLNISDKQFNNKEKYENFTEVYNDKTEIKKLSNFYNKYSYVTEDYEDEYDDTYDSHNIGASAVDDTFEAAEYRPFKTPRVLSSGNKNDVASDDGTGSDKEDSNFPTSSESSRGPKAKNHDVIGKSKGQGQDKNVVINRARKNANKAVRANHNRRAGAQWKRGQGMLPS